MGLGAVERLPLTLSLGRSSLFELSQTTPLFFNHLLTWREEGTDQCIRSDFQLELEMEQ